MGFDSADKFSPSATQSPPPNRDSERTLCKGAIARQQQQSCRLHRIAKSPPDSLSLSLSTQGDRKGESEERVRQRKREQQDKPVTPPMTRFRWQNVSVPPCMSRMARGRLLPPLLSSLDHAITSPSDSQRCKLLVACTTGYAQESCDLRQKGGGGGKNQEESSLVHLLHQLRHLFARNKRRCALVSLTIWE